MDNSLLTLLANTPVYVGQTFPSYKALCDFLGIPATTGKQRALDQRHLKCYFNWEKKEGSNQLTITETFYDHPKVFEDIRKGIHTTPLGGMMQNLILSTHWTGLYFSRRDMLLKMGLIPESVPPNQTTGAAWDYMNKCYRLLDSAVKQLNKKGHAVIIPVLIDRGTNAIVTTDTDWIAQYREIRQSMCHPLGAHSIVDVYRKGLEMRFWSEVDKRTEKEMGYTNITERVWIKEVHPEKGILVNKNELIKPVIDTVYSNYAHGHKGVIGTERIKCNPEKCQQYYNELINVSVQ